VSDFQEVIKQEERFSAFRVSYSEAMKAFLTLPISKKKARKDALHALQASATAFFNSFERLVVFGSLSGAANDKVWYRDKAETALNLLQIIHQHYKAVFARAEALGEDLALFTPSLTAYATIERLVAESFPEDAQKWKKKFEELGLPVRGFEGVAPPKFKTDLLLVTVNDIESQAVLSAFKDATGQDAVSVKIDDRLYNNLGVVNGTQVYHAISEMGSGGPGAMQQTSEKAVRALNPVAVIAIGVGFGVDESKQGIGDVLISIQLSLYELVKKKKKMQRQRGDKPHASPWLINHFKVAKAGWENAEVHFGLMLTGEKLIDEIDYRNQLLKVEPEAIGGEMEGAGLYVTCLDYKIDWIVLKAICDWADGTKSRNKKKRQEKAAKNACDLLIHALKKAPLKTK
jgi:nucleoside phosphorylase